ncbi:hypothetical protein [Kineococcus sp. SYSU DK003]|uniref:hypothetical protein n=1 Tax=Kineococcus sp. SYSU DK003 TaxID=3383124 RepID=UPI003D7D881E
MNSAQWWSQPVAAEGSTASEGIRRQLGKPRLDPLEVLVRETAQNTCDAGLPDEVIDYSIRLRNLSGNQLRAWQGFLLPEPLGSRLGLDTAMREAPLVMTIADRGTTGLGGPLRANEVPEPGERPDFVNFIRNVGERKNLDLGGGSYGFGKGILYNVSRCHVIVVDSVCRFRGKLQRRLIAAALGDGYTQDARRFTGRHWLGVQESDGHTRPLLNQEADEVSRRLGLPTFEPGITGTTIAVVDADLGNRRDGDEPRDGAEAAEFLASTMLWNLWPRMMSGRSNRLNCSVRRDGFVVEVPAPEETIELAPFVQAYRKLELPGEHQIPVRRAAPQEIGRFAVANGMAPLKKNALVAAAAPFEGAAHHCARMRQADLVVDYLEGESASDEMIQYGAVFKASGEADPYFAEAEPPTHDSWVTNGLSGTALGVVRLANSFIRDELRSRVLSSRPTRPVGDVPLAGLATRLSGLLAADGGAAEPIETSGPTSGTRPRLKGPRFLEGPELVVRQGRALVRGLVEFPDWAEDRAVVARPSVVLGPGNGSEPRDDGLPLPIVESWTSGESEETVLGNLILLGRSSPRVWELLVVPPADTVVRVDLETVEVDE